MNDINKIDSDQGANKGKRSDHLANERTFLAWMRTSVSLMIFGFVVEKFSLFVSLFEKEYGKINKINVAAPHGYSAFFGVLLIAIGALLCILAFIKYKKIEKEIDNEIFEESILLDVMLTLSILLVGLFLAMYVINV